jgi:hypothetical protein
VNCKIDLTVPSDRPYWVKWAEFERCVAEGDLASRESGKIEDWYLSKWFVRSADGDVLFSLPAFYLQESRAYFINGRHRSLLMSRYLEVIPMAVTQMDKTAVPSWTVLWIARLVLTRSSCYQTCQCETFRDSLALNPDARRQGCAYSLILRGLYADRRGGLRRCSGNG